jgi:toxin CptA
MRQFQFHPSRYFAAILVAAHITAIAALLSLVMPLWTKVAWIFPVLFSLIHHLRRDAWLSSPSAVTSLRLEQEQIMLITRSGEQVAGRILRDTLVTPCITVLNVLPHGARLARSVVILPDSLDAESFRQLRVWLKWGGNLAPAQGR